MTISKTTGRTGSALRAVLRAASSIRGRILVAFLTLSVITAGLGAFGASSLETTGDLVNKTFDRSLMSINYARAAATDFANIRLAFTRRLRSASPPEREELDAQIADLLKAFGEDLDVAAERAQSERAAREAGLVRRAVSDWVAARRASLEGQEATGLDGFAAKAEQHLDLLINYTAGDGFTYRQRARALVTEAVEISFAATVLAIVLSGLVTWLLSRQIIRPVAEASRVAAQIAAGDLGVAIPERHGDEVGELLRAMDSMRGNIAVMMAREVDQRRSAQVLLADAIQGLGEGVVVTDARCRVILANDRAADLLELGGDGPGGSEQHAQAKAFLRTLPGSPEETFDTQLADGRWLRVSRSATREGGIVAVCSDISLLKLQEARLRAINLRLDAALDNMSQGLCLYDEQDRLLVVNRRFADIFGISLDALPPGTSFEEVRAIVSGPAAGEAPAADALFAAQAELLARGGGGTTCQAINSACVVAVDQKRTSEGGWIATYEDVTERYEAEARIVSLARSDALTGLANRMVFNERLNEAAHRLPSGRGFAALCLDLDRFKEVNDTFGHPVGDGLLRGVAERLCLCVRSGDTVARLGGDEFAILQAESGTASDAVSLARHIAAAFETPFLIDGHAVSVGVSIGIVLAPEHGSEPEKLLKSADMALYRAKSDQAGAWRLFAPEMDIELQKRRALETDLRQALARNEFELLYQPIVDIAHGGPVSCEALLRWHHPRRGSVSPAEFVPLAEEIGLIGEIGQWVLRRACTEARRLPSGVSVAVNVSAVQFRNADLVRSVTAALAESGLAPNRLELEITESVLLTNSVGTLATLHAIKRLGVRIAMDDFGTGYSSLSYLQSFPFDKIKIDQSFVQNLDGAESSRLIVGAIVSLGRSLGMRVTAEGVETPVQLAHLREEGCTEAQGYLFSRPISFAKVMAFCSGRERKSA
ncbi:EAL domain-containing protein [Methylobacterium organophilum]|uniref:EAL domain-containing protein n=1 Tax=Methylobacterium organophilum TaxID=410 RepID=UPI001F13FF64|nr:EAL domain-containing protein [Methylobacterium organophilum]UMY18238.1 EAL domain-containing protein [Methylobacterium organophilum]